MANYFKKTFLIAAKDLRIEFRSKEKIYSMMLFSLLVMVIFNFAFEPGAEYIKDVAPGILWVAFIFAASLGLARSFVLEKEEDCMQGLMLSPLDRSGIYLIREFRHDKPLVDLRVFRHRNFAMGCLLIGLFGAAIYGLLRRLCVGRLCEERCP